jgi:hypothetical protein
MGVAILLEWIEARTSGPSVRRTRCSNCADETLTLPASALQLAIDALFHCSCLKQSSFAPVALHGAFGYPERFGDVDFGQAPEIAQFDDLSEPGVHRGEFLQRFVNPQHLFLGRHGGLADSSVERQVDHIAATTLGASRTPGKLISASLGV